MGSIRSNSLREGGVTPSSPERHGEEAYSPGEDQFIVDNQRVIYEEDLHSDGTNESDYSVSQFSGNLQKSNLTSSSPGKTNN